MLLSFVTIAAAAEPSIEQLANGGPPASAAPDVAALESQARRFSHRAAWDFGGAAVALGAGIGILAATPGQSVPKGGSLDLQVASGAVLLVGGVGALFVGAHDVGTAQQLHRRVRAAVGPAAIGLTGTF